MTRPRRSFLFVPGDDRRKIEKAASLGADCVCLDLEDGVALNRKAEARAVLTEALAALDFGPSERVARINAVGSGFETDDLSAILPVQPEAIAIPKVESGDQVRWVGEQTGRIPLIIQIESALGVVNLKEIVAAASHAIALVFGAEDYAASVGAIRTPESREVLYARSAVVAHAAAFGLQAIDIVYLDYNDTEGLLREAREGAQLGYSGKQIIHPKQIEPVHRGFAPSEAEIAHARRVVEAFQAHQAEGKGAFALDGKMVDMPIVKAAERVLARIRG